MDDSYQTSASPYYAKHIANVTASGAVRGVIEGHQGAMPRELGINERVCGLEAGLHNLVRKLEAFAERVDGGPCPTPDGKDAPAPTSLRPTLTRVESLLRRAHEITTALGEAF